jgi:hypothetical protein
MTNTHRVHAGVTASALCLAICGAMLLFAPDEASKALMLTPSSTLLVQLLGAALLGFGAMNWVARGAALGGIYGRSVVAGNQTHFLIGALILVKRGIEVGAREPAYWVLTGLYVLGAALFGYLMFFSDGLRSGDPAAMSGSQRNR